MRSFVYSHHLRRSVKKRLNTLHRELNALEAGEEYHRFRESLLRLLPQLEQPEKKRVLGSYRQVTSLVAYLEQWLNTALSDKEAFEMFIRHKAEEFQSGDVEHDFYEALLMRRDQLLAVTAEAELLTERIKVWMKLEAGVLVKEPEFIGLSSEPLEKRIYHTAQEIFRKRQNGGLDVA